MDGVLTHAACHAPWLVWYLLLRECLSGWWFGTFFIFHNIWDNPSHWLSYFSRWLKPPTSYIPPPWWWSSFEHKPGAGQSPCIWLYPKTKETQILEYHTSGKWGFRLWGFRVFQQFSDTPTKMNIILLFLHPMISHHFSLHLIISTIKKSHSCHIPLLDGPESLQRLDPGDPGPEKAAMN